MECPVCYGNASYVVNCGSSHKICDSCEVTLRMKEPATREGRHLTCPVCKVVEKVSGKRSTFSYEYELKALYGTPKVRPVQIRCCESGLICSGMTSRKCSYPDGCSRIVCTMCMMCISHF